MSPRSKTTTRNTTKDYDASDVKHLMDVKSWKNYDEMIAWLKRDGYDDNELTPGEVDHLLQDLNRIKQKKTEFITDPDRLCDTLKKSR
ncbi:MAG TPA: hypothetical protein VFX61_05285 [Micromonosporaceae bacterium]|nr:hypothetical protein [Micromonosporaceae bacterium]